MTDRKWVIDTLTKYTKTLISAGFEDEKVIKALIFAIESIKVDRLYDLAYEEECEEK